ncbi:MAG: steroid 5-alpha reductase [Flavobacteriaceae bacterium]|nr:MAG: steroid 5-alpha reductase [Flavobacteriaceae bacterium]
MGLGFATQNKIVINGIILVFIIHWALYIPANIFKTEKFYDLTGSLAYISVISYILYSKTQSFGSGIGEIVISIAIIIWSGRLGTFLFLRIKKDGEDKRFREYKKSWSKFLVAWTTSGMWVTICSACAMTAVASENIIELNIAFFTGLVLFIIGFSIEIIADYQKTKFRSISENKNKFITSGLWSKSRHPNYLGEIILWLGISVMSFSNLEGLQYITLISPIFTYWLIVYISGVSMLEKSGQEKWGHLKEYQDYIKKTPKLF